MPALQGADRAVRRESDETLSIAAHVEIFIQRQLMAATVGHSPSFTRTIPPKSRPS